MILSTAAKFIVSYIPIACISLCFLMNAAKALDKIDIKTKTIMGIVLFFTALFGMYWTNSVDSYLPILGKVDGRSLNTRDILFFSTCFMSFFIIPSIVSIGIKNTQDN